MYVYRQDLQNVPAGFFTDSHYSTSADVAQKQTVIINTVVNSRKYKRRARSRFVLLQSDPSAFSTIRRKWLPRFSNTTLLVQTSVLLTVEEVRNMIV